MAPILLVLLTLAAPSPNLLRNSGFRACANPGDPDWWGTGAASQHQDWSGRYGTSDDAPLRGVRSVRMVSPADGPGISVQSYAYSLASGRDYTFSIYLKGDSDQVRTSLGIGDRSQAQTVTRAWQRHVFTAQPEKGHWAAGRLIVRFGISGPGTLWAAAPQLELGPSATAYQPSPQDFKAADAPPAPVIPAHPLPIPSAACPKVSAGPALDGKLDDACWSAAARLGGFCELATGNPAGRATDVMLLRDDARLYLAFRCREPDLAHLATRITRRDGAVFSDDSVEVFLQPEPRSGSYLHLAVNAAGVQYDERVFDHNWNADWQAVTGRGDGEWTVELGIPFTSLGLTRAAAETWRVNFCRNHPAAAGPEFSAWSCTYSGYHVPERFGRLSGFAPAETARWFTAPRPPRPVVEPQPALPALEATFELSYYTREPVARLWVTSRLAEAVRIEAPGLAAVGPDVVRPGQSAYIAFAVNAEPPGRREVQVVAHTASGVAAAQAVVELVKLPPSPVEVRMHRVGRYLIANGKPLLVYAQGLPAMRTGWWLDDVQSHGFNTVILGVTAARSDADLDRNEPGVRAFLDDCGRRGLHVIVWLHPGGGAYPPLREGVVRTMRRLRDHPAVLLWYLVDEPEGWWESQDGGKQEADLVDLLHAAKEADPYRPAQINWYAWSRGRGGYGSLDATEIGSLDRYPVGRGRNCIEVTSEITSLMNRDCRPRHQPTSFWAQMYGYDDAVREPTPAEETGMTYVCLIDGMRLVYYFIYKPMSTGLWESMEPLGRELRDLEPILCDPDTRQVAGGVQDGRIHYAVYRQGGRGYLVAVNGSEQPATLALPVAKLLGRQYPAAVRWYDAQPLYTRNGLLTAPLHPNQRLVVELY